MISIRSQLIKDSTKPVVAVITPGSLPVPAVLGGGIQTVVYEYAIPNKEQNIIIVSALDGGLPAFELDKQGIGHIRIRNRSYDNIEIVWRNEYLIRYNRYIYKACKILKELDADLVHIHNRPHFVPIVRKLLGPKVKIVLTNHNLKIAEEKYVLKRLPKIMQAVDKVVYPSKKVAELDLLKDNPTYKEKVEVIYNGVDENVFKKASSEQIEQIREKYKISSKKVLLFVGRLVLEKGVDTLLSALPEIVSKDPEVSLVIVGSSFFGKGQKTPYVKKLIELAQPVKDNVIFTGFIDIEDLPVIYSLATVFVSPVDWDDPSPKTIYEAAACETAIVSSNRGGIPEIVINNESALLLDTPFTKIKLAQILLAILKDDKKRDDLIKNAKQRILSNFTCNIIGQKWAALYKDILEKN
ncbi:glycosyltransferase family 4 protein [Candidatus Margulisiibacteriota bacterium]